jgi:hypothetical protein
VYSVNFECTTPGIAARSSLRSPRFSNQQRARALRETIILIIKQQKAKSENREAMSSFGFFALVVAAAAVLAACSASGALAVLAPRRKT